MALLEPGRNCWRVEPARRASLIVDAADYFRLAQQAMLRARHQILLIGWDFDTRIRFRAGRADAPDELGDFLLWLAKRRPALQVHLLKWDVGTLKLLGRGRSILTMTRWALHRRIHFKLDGAHPTGASHHHKIVVIDDALAFCGGIDMTANRWDTREHRPRHPARVRPGGEPTGPWHDATMALDGPAARALGELGRERWRQAGGEPLRAPPPGSDPWPSELAPTFQDVRIGIARTRGRHGELPPLREVEALYLDLIAGARRFVYAENQYFASPAIAAAIARRLAEPDGPEFLLVNPLAAEGWLEEEAMGSARARLVEALRGADPHGRFRIYTPAAADGQPIYVHAKVTVVDDRLLRVGSANMNSRSMGLDSECDVVLDASLPGNEHVGTTIARVRCDLMAEHLGTEPETVARAVEETGSLLRATERLRLRPGRTLVPFDPPPLNAAEEVIAETGLLDPDGTQSSPFEPIARARRWGLVRGPARARAR